MSYISIYKNEINHHDNLVNFGHFQVIVFESEAEAYEVKVNLISGNIMSVEQTVKQNYFSRSAMTNEIQIKTTDYIEIELQKRSYVYKNPLWAMSINKLSKSTCCEEEKYYAVDIGDNSYSIELVSECAKHFTQDLLVCCMACDSVFEKDEAYRIDESDEYICESCLETEKYAVRCEFKRHGGNKVVRIEDAEHGESGWICYHCKEMLSHDLGDEIEDPDERDEYYWSLSE